jgi:hypothetical protein
VKYAGSQLQMKTLIMCINIQQSAAVTKKRVDGHFFSFGSNPRPIYEISITSGFYLTVLFTSEDKYAMNEG